MKQTQQSVALFGRRMHNSGGSITSFVLYVLVISCNQNVFAQQQPQPPGSAGTSSAATTSAPSNDKLAPTGSIKGRVVGDGDRAPSNIMVSTRALNGGSRVGRTTRADAEGRFVFDNLPAAVYTVMAMAPGYIDEAIASSTVSELPRHLIGSQLRIRMVKGGVITGIVTNAKGDPVVGVNVLASLVADQRDITATFVRETPNAETDDRGIYRIYGLTPGDYTVSAGGRGGFGRFVTTGFELDAPTFYPSSTRDTAIPITVRSGEETTGIDITYRGLQGHSISGVVLHKAEPTTSMNMFTVSLWHVKTDALVTITAANPADGRLSFTFEGIADGEYEVSTTFFSNPTSNALSGTKRVIVRGSDVTGIDLSMSPLSSIEGSLKLEPIETAQKCDKRGSQLVEISINARSETPKSGARRRVSAMYAALTNSLDANNTFTMRHLEPGKFRFDIRLPTDAWYVREIRMPTPATPKDAAEAPQAAVWQGTGTIKAGENISGVVVTVGQDAAGLRGRVVLPNGVSDVPQNLEVHLVPVDREHANNALRYYETSVDSDGQFRISNIAPGRYFSITRIRPATEISEKQTPAAWNPARRARIRRDAETSKSTLELKGCERLNDYVLNVTPAP